MLRQASRVPATPTELADGHEWLTRAASRSGDLAITSSCGLWRDVRPDALGLLWGGACCAIVARCAFCFREPRNCPGQGASATPAAASRAASSNRPSKVPTAASRCSCGSPMLAKRAAHVDTAPAGGRALRTLARALFEAKLEFEFELRLVVRWTLRVARDREGSRRLAADSVLTAQGPFEPQSRVRIQFEFELRLVVRAVHSAAPC